MAAVWVWRTAHKVPRAEGYCKIQASQDAGLDDGAISGGQRMGSDSRTILEGKYPYSTYAGLKPKFVI